MAFYIDKFGNRVEITGGGVLAESGQVYPATGVADLTLNNTWKAPAGMQFTATSAGTYEVQAHIVRGGSQGRLYFSLSVDNVVNESIAQHFGFGGSEVGMDPVFQISVQSGQTVRLVARDTANSSVIFLNDTGFTLGRRPSMRWKKIAGFAPVTGQAAGFASAVKTALQSVGNNTTNVTFETVTGNITQSGGAFTLAAGNTYELIATVSASGNSRTAWQWYDITNATWLGGHQGIVAVSDSNSNGVGMASALAITTPTTTVQVALRQRTNLNTSIFVPSVDLSGTSVAASATIKQLGTTSTSAFTGVAMSDWNIANSYASGTVVVYNKTLYQANAFIGAGTAFTIGTTGSTWTALQTGTGYVNEYGEATLASNVVLNDNDIETILTANIPSAGTWEIDYSLNISTEGATINDSGLFWIADANGNEISGTGQQAYATSAANIGMTLSRKAVVTTTGATTYTVRGQRMLNTGTALTVQGGTTVGSTQVDFNSTGYKGTSKVSWTKIGGAIPITGAVTSFVNAVRLNTSQTLVGSGTDLVFNSVVSGNIPANTTTGVFTLTAGVTYQLTANCSWNTFSNTIDGFVNYAWVDATTNAVLPNCRFGLALPLNRANANETGDLSTTITYTPSTNQTVKVRVMAATGTASLRPDYSSATITQLGTTSTSGFTGAMSNEWNIANSYVSGTIVIKDALLYQANAFINAGTAFAEGTTGSTWKSIGITRAEFGNATINAADSASLSSNSSSPTTLMTFSIPSAGTWELTATVTLTSSSGTANWAYYDSTGTIVPNSVLRGSYEISAGLNRPTTDSILVTTTGATTYTVRGWTSNTASFTNNSTGGHSTGIYKKISGFVGLTKKVFTEPVTIEATTTAPTKPTVREKDFITLIDDDTGWCEVIMDLYYSSTTGGANGSGIYLFKLPAGYRFDLTAHPALGDTGVNADTWPKRLSAITSTYAVDGTVARTSDGVQSRITAVAHSATQFKFYAADSSYNYITGANYQIIQGPQRISAQFKFKKA